MTRQRGYLFLVGLLLAGSGMTAGLSVIMPSLSTLERATEAPTEPAPATAPAPIVQSKTTPAVSEPARSTAEAQPPAAMTPTEAPESEPASPQIEASVPAEPAQLPPESLIPAEPLPPPDEASIPAEPPPQQVVASIPAEPPQQVVASAPAEPPQLPPESLIPAEPLPPPAIVLSPSLETHADLPATLPQSPSQLAALTPPAEPLPAQPLPQQPVSLRDTALPAVPLPRERPAELTSDATALAADLFSKVTLPSTGPAHVVGFYSAGCIAGAQQLALQGRYWQVMRPSRDRYWGHPELIAFIERVARDVVAHTGWPGILIGDMAQPRGGPLPAGHASHQIGLDVDIWLKPMPKEPYTRAETESVPMVSAVATNNKQLDKNVWQAEDATLIKIAAEQPEVERVFVNPVIKKELCRTKTAADESWMSKVRPWYGHDEHVHVRLKCPPGSPACRAQDGVPDGDGCGKALDHWFTPGILAIQEQLRTQAPVNRGLKMRALPAGCVAVLHAPATTNQFATSGR